MDSSASPGLVERWASVGDGPPLGLLAVQLWQVDLPFLRPVTTSQGTHRRRPMVFVHLVASTSGTLVEGWGECAALADTTYDDEDVTRAFALLQHALVPALLDRTPVAGSPLPRPVDLGLVRRAAPDAVLGFAALEMAVADAHLRAEGRSLATALGVPGRPVAIGAVVGRADSTDRLLSEVGPLVEAGYLRVKLKIGPGWDTVPVRAVRERFPDLVLQADANGAYTRVQADRLAELDSAGLACIEQPLDPADLEGHAALAERLATPICLDESLDSPRTVRRALELGACSVVCVKPSRLGGLGAALEVVELCVERGVPLWVGGMYESGFARGVNATLSALPGFTLPGDLAPARTYLGDDLVTQAIPHRDGPSGTLMADLPDGPGLGPSPDRSGLERLVRRRVWFELPRP